jgi:hypothetical protein
MGMWLVCNEMQRERRDPRQVPCIAPLQAAEDCVTLRERGAAFRFAVDGVAGTRFPRCP